MPLSQAKTELLRSAVPPISSGMFFPRTCRISSEALRVATDLPAGYAASPRSQPWGANPPLRRFELVGQLGEGLLVAFEQVRPSPLELLALDWAQRNTFSASSGTWNAGSGGQPEILPRLLGLLRPQGAPWAS